MFTPLHLKSDYSLGYGIASVEEIVDRAKTLGYPSIAVTDLENLYGQVRFHDYCRTIGMHAITGVELRPGFTGRRSVGVRKGRLVLLAADARGYQSLCRIVSQRRCAQLERADDPLLQDLVPVVARYPEGLFALSDDPEVIRRLARAGGVDPDMLGLLVVRPAGRGNEQALFEVSRAMGVRLVADLDAIFLSREDHLLHLLQLAIAQGRLVAETGDETEGEERLLRPPSEVEALFSDLPQALAGNEEISERCRFDLGPGTVQAPDFNIFEGVSADVRLRQLCLEGRGRTPRDLTSSSQHRERLEQELRVLGDLGFSGFMLVVAEILSHCRDSGIPVMARGSAVSSLVLHLLGGSPIDPVREGLLFERFLHAGKSSWPDVDLDIPWHRRDEVIEWVYRRFGREHVAMVAAHHTFRYRSALAEGLKALGKGPAEIRRYVAAIPPEDLDVQEVDFIGVEPEDQATGPAAGDVLPLVRRLVGKPRHVAVHPGGAVVDRRNLEDILPLERAPKGVVITQYDLVAVARLGLVKVDLLGNRCLTELEETYQLAGKPPPFVLEEVPKNDPPTFALIDRADTLGCFQLESPAMRALLARLPVRSQHDLVAALALIRPGAAAGALKAAFISRARGEEPERLEFPEMVDRLSATHGIFLYEEDVMLLLSRAGGVTLEEADELRRGIVRSGGDPALLAPLHDTFMEHARQKRKLHADKAWETAVRLAAYSFNKAHAASYAYLAYCSAYTKARYPVQFACSAINNHQGIYPLRTLAADFARGGIAFLGADVNRSSLRSTDQKNEGTGEEGRVRLGLDRVKYLSRHAAQSVVETRERQGNYRSFRELLERNALHRGEMVSLILSGACDGLAPLEAENYPFAHEVAAEMILEGAAPAAFDLLVPPLPVGAAETIRLYQSMVRVRNELKYLGMAVSAHPMELLRPEASRYGCASIGHVLSAPAKGRVRLAVVLAAMRRVATKKGAMVFLTLEDETALLEGVILPPDLRRIGEVLFTPGPYLVEGVLRREQGATYLEILRLSPFHERHRPYGKV